RPSSNRSGSGNRSGAGNRSRNQGGGGQRSGRPDAGSRGPRAAVAPTIEVARPVGDQEVRSNQRRVRRLYGAAGVLPGVVLGLIIGVVLGLVVSLVAGL